MCKVFLASGNCQVPNCAFAHDERELRTTDGFFKTKLCRFASSGRCKHGVACRFAHDPEELADIIPIQPGQRQQQSRSNSNLLNEMLDHQIGQATGGTGMRPRQPQFQMDMAPEASGQEQNLSAGESFDQRTNRDGGSDQSTRADTSASVPTPEGSGDSGPEEWANGSAPSMPMSRRGTGTEDRGRQRRSGASDRASAQRHCTTMMITNVPQFLTQGALVSLLEDLTVHMRGAFDFFYCPWDPYQDRNLGYAIVNFFARSVAAEFETQWANQQLLPGTHGAKRLRIVPAALQGRAANLRHFSGFSLAHHADPRFRPLVRVGPNEQLRPMAVAEEIAESGMAQLDDGNCQDVDSSACGWESAPSPSKDRRGANQLGINLNGHGLQTRMPKSGLDAGNPVRPAETEHVAPKSRISASSLGLLGSNPLEQAALAMACNASGRPDTLLNFRAGADTEKNFAAAAAVSLASLGLNGLNSLPRAPDLQVPPASTEANSWDNGLGGGRMFLLPHGPDGGPLWRSGNGPATDEASASSIPDLLGAADVQAQPYFAFLMSHGSPEGSGPMTNSSHSSVSDFNVSRMCPQGPLPGLGYLANGGQLWPNSLGAYSGRGQGNQ